MREISYDVRRADGTEFHTTNYIKATEEGNRIIKTILTPVDTRTEKEKEMADKYREKVNGILAKKRKETANKKTGF